MNCTQRLVSAFLILVPWSGQIAVFSQDDLELRQIQRKFTDEISPLLHQYCGDCHTGADAESGFDLDSFTTLDQLLDARKKWKKVVVRVVANEMPPSDSVPLQDDERTFVLDWVNHLLNSVDCTQINPGRVPLRRLNRTEYKNTIRDLIGVDYEPASEFPGDDVGYGFDNIAEVMSLPPILMEKYLNAAEQITMQAIVDPTIPLLRKTITGNQFKPTAGSHPQTRSHLMTTQGTISYDLELPESGKYEIVVRAYQDQAGDEPAQMALGVGNKSTETRAVRATLDSQGDYPFSIRLEKGKQRLEISFLNDFYQPANDDQTAQDRNLHLVQLTLTGPTMKVSEQQRQLIPESPTEPDRQRIAARKAINRFASRAYRRRAMPDELDRLMLLFDQAREEGECYELSIRFTFQAILVSPYFLYRVESPSLSNENATKDATKDASTESSIFLSDFELATRLSYFLWSTMPDAELLRLASKNELRNHRVYQQQIERMLKDPKAKAMVENFATQWLQLEHLDLSTPDPDLFPGTDQDLKNDMVTETKMVVADLIRRDASVLDLLATDYSFINQRLARHYGIEGINGDEFRKISAEQSGRFGLMTHASILTLTSNPTRTSPVKRGKWIMENLLGESPPAPAASVMQLEDQPELHGTLRERMEQHRADPNCASCHVVMDQLGFALEHYDAVGRWRETDGTSSIDASGKLPDGRMFEGAQELQSTIQQTMQIQFVRCLTEKLLIYSLGRGLEYFDECTVDRIIKNTEPNGFRFSELIMAIATSDPFLKRHGSTASGEERVNVQQGN